jgi:thioredoxin
MLLVILAVFSLLLLIAFAIPPANPDAAQSEPVPQMDISPYPQTAPGDPWFRENVTDVAGLVIVEFAAVWCGPCQMIEAQLADLNKEFPDQFSVVKLDVDARPNLAYYYDASSIPLLLFFRDGQLVGGMRGASSYEVLKAHIQPHLKATPRQVAAAA